LTEGGPGTPDAASEPAVPARLACDAAFFGCTTRPTVIDAVDPDTHRFVYTHDENITGTWSVALIWSRSGDTIRLDRRFQRLVVRPGSATVSGVGRTSGQSVALSIRRGQAIGLANPTTTADAGFSATVRRNGQPDEGAQGRPGLLEHRRGRVPDRAGDQHRAGSRRRGGTMLQESTGERAVPGADGSFQNVGSTMSDATGAWSDDVPVSAGWIIQAWCGNAKGDAILLRLVAN